MRTISSCVVLGLVASSLVLTGGAEANGGPFVIKYPGGDPAAKGVLARLGEDLRPGREGRLRVVREDLQISFEEAPLQPHGDGPPVVRVVAAYEIENPTGDQIEVDFGFPILRGIFTDPRSMLPRPSVSVLVDNARVEATIIATSSIYGLVRRRARSLIESAIAHDALLARLVTAVREGAGERRRGARQALHRHLCQLKGWSERDATLMVEYAGLDLGADPVVIPAGLAWSWSWRVDQDLARVALENLGPLAAIGEQKATQLLAVLTSRLAGRDAAGYEEIFTAWGGDVRERSLDLPSGRVRPRVISLADLAEAASGLAGDPTVYARVDYLDDGADLTDAERASCRAILANLPVVFTFAPMNILHYRVSFAPGSMTTLSVHYQQYAYLDSQQPASYQLAYVLHPATMWDDFGPILLEVRAPAGVGVAGSVPLVADGEEPAAVGAGKVTVHRARLTDGADKTGELYVAVAADQWRRASRRLRKAALEGR